MQDFEIVVRKLATNMNHPQYTNETINIQCPEITEESWFIFIFASNIFMQGKPLRKLFSHGALLQNKKCIYIKHICM